MTYKSEKQRDFVEGKKKILLRGYGSLISKTVDIANLLTEDLIPDEYTKTVKSDIENITTGNKKHKTSVVTITLKKK